VSKNDEVQVFLKCSMPIFFYLVDESFLTSYDIDVAQLMRVVNLTICEE
jgi:hypothetical protein